MKSECRAGIARGPDFLFFFLIIKHRLRTFGLCSLQTNISWPVLMLWINICFRFSIPLLNVTFVPTIFLFEILSIYLRSWKGIKIAGFVSYGHTSIKNDGVQSSLRYGTLDCWRWMLQNLCVSPAASKSLIDAHFSFWDRLNIIKLTGSNYIEMLLFSF